MLHRLLPLLFVLAVGLNLPATEARAQCVTSLANGVNTRTCTGAITGQQQVRGGNTEEKLILQSGTITNDSGNGILGRDDSGAGKVTVQIDGGTVDASGTGINFDMGRSSSHPNGHSNVDINDGAIKADQGGVNINHRPASTRGRITFDMSGGSIGLMDDRVGATGLSAGIQATANSMPLSVNMTGGSIFATHRGMSLSHSGTGLIDVDIGSGATIDTLGQPVMRSGRPDTRQPGLFISRSGDGSIDVDNAGTIRSAGHDGLFILNSADGAVTIDHQSGGRIEAANNGIYVRQGDSSDGGGAVTVTSAGDITTTGPTGILLDLARGDLTADDDVSVTLTDGTIKAVSTGVQVNSRTRGGLTFAMTGGTIGAARLSSSSGTGLTGVSLNLSGSTNAKDLAVDLTSGRIFGIWRGLALSHAGSGKIALDLGRDSRINTRESLVTVGDDTLTRGAGVYAEHNGSGAIEIDHEGRINSGAGGGIYARHNGAGDLTINNRGAITAGFQGIDARRTSSGRITVNHLLGGAITASRGPGIFVRHDARRTANKYDVDVLVDSDVTTTSPGHAAVNTYMRGPAASAGVRIRQTGGTLTGFGGITATDARFSGSTYTGPTPPGFTLPSGILTKPKVHVTVGIDGRIVARGSAAGGPLPEVDRVTRGLVGTTGGQPRGITVGGGDYVVVGRFIAEGDGDIALTPQERAVVNAVYGAGNLETALNALPADPYDDVYKNTVRWYAGAYNDSDFRVDFNGEITSAGDGIRLIRRHNVNDRNGGAHVVIMPDGKVSAHRYGVRLRGAGMDGDGLRRQRVEVRGELESTGPDGAAIALRGGGYVTIGADTRLEAASGTTILVDDPDPVSAAHPASCESHEATGGVCPDNYDSGGANLVVEIRQGADEAIADTLARAAPGRIVNPGATRALVRTGDDVSLVPIRITPVTPGPTSGGGSTSGGGGGGTTGPTVPEAPIPSAGNTEAPTWLTLTAEPSHPHDRMVSGAHGVWMDCDDAACLLRKVLEPRARVYEALPSILLDMNDVQGRFLHRDGTGTWGGPIAAERDLKDANTSYGLTRTGLILGHDFRTSEDGTFGLSVHNQAGAARIDHGGEIDTMATGVSVSHRWDLAPLALGLNASASSFSSTLTSSLRGRLATGLSGTGHAVGVEAGVALTDTLLTLGLTHKAVEADGFTSVLRDPTRGTAAVRVADIRGEETMLRLGADYRRPAGALFVGLDLPLDSEAEARVGNTRLSSRSRASAHLQGSLAFDGAVLSLGYATTGDDNSVRAGLTVRF